MHFLKNFPEIHQLIEGGIAQELGHACFFAMAFLSNGRSDVRLICQLFPLCMGQRTFALQMSLLNIWLFCILLRFFLRAIATRATRGVDCDIREQSPHSSTATTRFTFMLWFIAPLLILTRKLRKVAIHLHQTWRRTMIGIQQTHDDERASISTRFPCFVF